jgi:hypothetical protein
MSFIELASQARPQFVVERLDRRRLLSADAGVDESALETDGLSEVVEYVFDESDPGSWIWCSFEVMPLMASDESLQESLDETVDEPMSLPESDGEGEVVIYTMTDDVLMMGSESGIEPDLSVQASVVDAPSEGDTPALAPPPGSAKIARIDRMASTFATIFESNADDTSVI